MTAVARLTVNKHPLLIGDLLTSWRAASATQVALPIVEINYGSEIEIGAKGLHQKIALVADHIIVGWAGAYSAAADLIGELKQRCEHEHFSSRLVGEYIRQQPKSLWDDISVAGFIFDDDIDNLCAFRCGCRAIETPLFGETALLGLGGPELEKYFQTTTTIPDAPEDPGNHPLQAAALGMAAVGNFLTMELNAAENLTQLFSGGHEIARSPGKNLSKSMISYTRFGPHNWTANVKPSR